MPPSPGTNSFMARHLLQPAPGFRTCGAPYCSLCRFTRLDPTHLPSPCERPAPDVFQGRALDELPPEVVLRVLHHLDLPDLCRISSCSRTLNVLAKEALLRPRGAELTLRQHWDVFKDKILLALFGSGSPMRVSRLDLSWIPPFDQVRSNHC